MKIFKIVLNIVFYFLCFGILALSVYQLAFLIPPKQDDPSFFAYQISSGLLAMIVSLLIVIPFMILEYRYSSS